MTSTLHCIIELVLMTALASNAQHLRGLDPDLAAHYNSASKQFQCIDQSTTIPFEQVNDDYCDCKDGSDEPGTAACNTGSFYCANLGYEPKRIRSAFVDDGYCDCCDGSDEKSGCMDTCVQQGLAALESLRQKIEFQEFGFGIYSRRQHDQACDLDGGPYGYSHVAGYSRCCHSQVASQQQGLARRRQYVSESEEIIIGWATERAALTPEIEEQQKEVDRLKAILDEKQEVERKLDEERRAIEEAKRKEEEEKRAAEEELRKAEEEKRAAEAAANPPVYGSGEEGQADGGPEGGGEGAEGQASGAEGDIHREGLDEYGFDGSTLEVPSEAQPASDVGDGGAQEAVSAEQAGEQAPGVEDEVSKEDLGKKIASQWIKDVDEAPPHVDTSYSEEAEAAEDAFHYEHQDYDDIYIPPYSPPAEPQVPATEQEHAAEAAPTGFVDKVKGWISSKLLGRNPAEGSAGPPPAPPDPLQLARDATSAARAEYSTANGKLSGLNSKQSGLDTKLGLDFGTDKQFTALHGKCFEGQFDKYTYSVCLYGSASQQEGGGSTNLGSFREFTDNYSVAVFDNGAYCWQGPNRSIKVHLHCGAEERILKVEEPSRCEYVAQMETPAACSDAAVAALEDELRHKEQLIRAAGKAKAAGAGNDQHDEL